MIQAIHDITSTQFRDPAGAVRAGSSVALTLMLQRIPKRMKPVLLVRFDKDSSTRMVPMKRVSHPGTPSGWATFTTLFSPSEKGLWWYWFAICNESNLPPGFDQLSEEEKPTHGISVRGTGRYTISMRRVLGGKGSSGKDSDSEGPDGKGGRAENPATSPAALPVYSPGAGIQIGRDSASGQAVVTNDPHAWQLTVCEPSYAPADWIHGGVFYHIFVDRFAKCGDPVRMEGKITREDWGGMPEYLPNENGEILNNDFFGGNLMGIRAKLPYLEKLGVTCLYLSPVFEAYSSHKYDTSDYMKIDPMFGDEEGFTRLCKEAASRGIRVICDGVFSHTGSDSRYFDEYDRYGNGALHHPDSPYRSWYYFEQGGYQTWWGIRTLPRINKLEPSYQEFINGENGVIRHWLRAGASGWRLDVVDELPSVFLEQLTAAAKAEKPDALILGEVWEDASNKIAYEERKNYFEGNKLDSVMNYPLRRAIISFVREGRSEELASVMEQIMENYPLSVVHSLMNILGTHDTDRIITALAGRRLGPEASREEKAAITMDDREWELGIQRLKLAVVLQMTLPGVPCIYYGDEAGMEGYNDPFNRRCYPWGAENPDLQNWYRKVIRIRRENEVFREGGYKKLASKDGLFMFERTGSETRASGSGSHASGLGAQALAEVQALVGKAAGIDTAQDRLIIAVNCGEHHRILPLPHTGRWEDLLSGAIYEGELLILPSQALILKQKG